MSTVGILGPGLMGGKLGTLFTRATKAKKKEDKAEEA